MCIYLANCYDVITYMSVDDVCIKIDRPNGIIKFGKAKKVDAVLSDWNKNIHSLLGIMETTSHLINRENMVYKIK